MVENHALAVVHLYETLLDFYKVLSSGEHAADPKRIKELLMRYDFLFVQDLEPKVCYAQHIQLYFLVNSKVVTNAFAFALRTTHAVVFPS